ncbi:MAG: hypothetical protein JEZ00_16820 [Anaerolineaceae bacterium]|nr:hypothetical protein [Anaerolineaceae bacterium]
MDAKEIFPLFHQVLMNLAECYTNTVEEEVAASGINARDFYIGILAAKCFDPDPISAERLRKRIPYNAAAYYEATLGKLLEAEFLEAAPEGGYLLNQQGIIIFRRTVSIVYRQMEACTSFSTTVMEDIKHLLAKLVQASLLSDDPPCKWSILHSRRLDPGHNVAAIVKIDQYLSDLTAYRDDAHLASWQQYGVSGHAWDILGIVWQGKAATIAELLPINEKRQWSEVETMAAIAELVKQSWLEKGAGLSLTQKGRSIREEAESLTDQYFFAPWSILSDQEMNRLGELLTTLAETLEKKP